jgi:hypothetical protein
MSSYGYAGLGGFGSAANPFNPFGSSPFGYSPFSIAGSLNAGMPTPFTAPYAGYANPFGLAGYGAMPYNYSGFGSPQYAPQQSKCPNCPNSY